MGPRKANIERETKETSISASLNLDGQGQVEVETGVGFLNHMISSAMIHGYFDLKLTARGDTQVDDHHTVEDAGIVLGQAFKEALGDFAGVKRFGEASAPMDEACARVVVDLSRRPYLVFSVPVVSEKTGSFDSQLIEEFWRAFVNNCEANLHIEVTRGKNMHHIFEAVFKAAGRALDQASQPEPRASGVTSTKGAL
ncbi:MAG: imidazoleglycerol-phosphate dehydratase HisB [Deltaproteobacteria bacterium]|nr:imidazoleglycerol-phosphate dehydratase HisB [Deltaproteobacteria bacterium]MBW2051795.1 imidazoleglycerol-phosphate dehydratase HisB [Deltaproteobacteria bacterium]MBW2139661.1 imidazoleglycerol-phosphate dehydratase HisB [Deltaproteobacteria bacterium]MBW2322158.1 imidazoleglycerol-phosphate dehydratase HisB [Deltaproteobacteria bacterium]